GNHAFDARCAIQRAARRKPAASKRAVAATAPIHCAPLSEKSQSHARRGGTLGVGALPAAAALAGAPFAFGQPHPHVPPGVIVHCAIVDPSIRIASSVALVFVTSILEKWCTASKRITPGSSRCSG